MMPHFKIACEQIKKILPGISSLPLLFSAGEISYAQSIRAMVIESEFNARCIPGQILRPNPKGTSNRCNRGSLVSRKRSGRKASGEGNITGKDEASPSQRWGTHEDRA